MYSILRVTGRPDGPGLRKALDALALSINAEQPGAARDRRSADGFAVEISSSATWADHQRSLMSLVSTFTDEIARATQLGASVTLDVALEPGDEGVGPYMSVRFEVEQLALLSTAGVGVEVTRYP